MMGEKYKARTVFSFQFNNNDVICGGGSEAGGAAGASGHGQLPHNVLPHLTVGLGLKVTSLDSPEAGYVLLTVSVVQVTLVTW